MKKFEKIAYLKENYMSLWLMTRRQNFINFSDRQKIFCCCGRLATGNHENNCKKFNEKVNSATIKDLSYLIPKNKKQTK